MKINPFILLATGILLFSACSQEIVDTQISTDPNLVVSVYDSEKASNGTTLFTDGHDKTHLRVVEINMEGGILWEYVVPQELIKGQPVGFDAELLENGDVLIVLSGSGVYEVDRDGNIVWSYEDPKVSHDADRLANGNTLINFGANDKKMDAVIKEVSPDGELVWEWYAEDVYGTPEFTNLESKKGWTHANAVQRLSNGNTMVSLRNFYLTTIVDKNGQLVADFDWSSFGADTDPHEPEIDEAAGTLLISLQNGSPYVAVEIDMDTGETLWTYSNDELRTARDCNRLKNGNVLIVAVGSDDTSTMIEVSPEGEIVWRLDLENFPAKGSPGFFFKAQRIEE
ncbi:MAG: aryl-sulfate sulfotransferase [Candidatus Gracilibacteria bacterium]